MNGFNFGDKVEIKKRLDWGATDPGYVMEGTVGTVVEPSWIKWDELTKDFDNFIYVKLEECKVTDYIGNTFLYRAENLMKL